MKNCIAFIFAFSFIYNLWATTYITKSDGYWSDQNIWTYTIGPGFNPDGDTIIVKHCVIFDSVLTMSNCRFTLDTNAILCGHKRLQFNNSTLFSWGFIKCDSLYCYATTGYTYSTGYTTIQFYGLFWGGGAMYWGGGVSSGPDFWCSCTVGIPESENDRIKIYPNPFSESAILDLQYINGSARIRIYDLQGKEVYQASFTGKTFLISRNGLAPGVYFYEVTTGENKLNGKLIIE